MANFDERVHYVHASDGVRLAITEVFRGAPSNGPGVLCLHGFAQTRLTFTVGPMPGGFLDCGARVFIAELRGHGRSERPSADWDIHTHLDLDLPALLEGVRSRTGQDVHLVGHSMGGMLGYAGLNRGWPLASLSTLCAPMIVGATRNAVRAAGLFAPLIAAATPAVPMDRFLHLVSRPLTKSPFIGLSAVQRFTSLVNPRLAPRGLALEVLQNAEVESPAVMKQIAQMAVHRRSELVGIDLAANVYASTIPVCVVVGTLDVFAPPESVAPFNRLDQRGRRRLIQIPEGSHVDVPIGHHARALAADIWRFGNA